MNTKELLESWPGLSDQERADLLSAISTRGKHSGFLLCSAPSSTKRPMAHAAWCALVSNLAPQRIPVFSLMLGAGEDFKRLDDALERVQLRTPLNACEPPFRWNLFAHRFDVDAMRAEIERRLRAEGLMQ
jgi:hypothetical protein